MYRPDYFHGGYAVHGMTSVPAYPASHGCVRMTVPAMDRMWSSLWVGMPVAIYSS
jgi:lipoprotein-anchoring transpeptidase ErfK/SrfK